MRTTAREANASRLRSLREEIVYAYQEVDLLREHLRRAGLDPTNIRSLDDFLSVPPTTKTQYRAAASAGVARRADLKAGSLAVHLSSGVSGEPPLKSWADPITLTQRMAVLLEVNPLLEHAIDRMQSRGPVRVAPRSCSPLDWERPSLSRSDRVLPDGTLVLDLTDQAWRAREDVFDQAIHELSGWTASWLYADPVYLALLASRLAGGSHQTPPIDSVVLTYSMCLGVARSAIERALREASIVEVLALSELGWVGIECPAGSMHLNEHDFHIEVLTAGTRIPLRHEGLGQLVITTIGDRVMPRIRYATGDLCSIGVSDCPCGHVFPVMRFHGRLEDCIDLPDGSLLTPRRLDDAIGRPDGLLLYQLEQQAKLAFTIHCLVDRTCSYDVGSELVRRLRPLIGSASKLAVEIGLDKLQSSSGKFRSCLPLARLELGPEP